ncbi:Serine hydroxymethyltransferase-like domain [Dillenia turbinata]|uniref:Serine hydroxymethyltransferase n=1 Tax=Dillenia turbinata TaxID=194707 RepID=A0AAN8W1Z9_9MAGN
MDLSSPQSSLSPGVCSHASFTDSSSSHLAFQLFDQDPLANYHENGEIISQDEKIRLLGQPMCVNKRPRDSSSSSSSNNCKRMATEQSLEARRAAVRSWGNQPLRIADPDLFNLMEKEKQRQFKGIELIASENFVCQAVMEALGSHLTNKYSEGMPGARYYVGNQHIDQIELLCCERALKAFDLDSENWGVNVQPYSCTSANFAIYTGLLQPRDRIMGLDLPSGGHMSHGYYMGNGKKVSGASIFFESLAYKVNPQTGYIDYDKLEEKALDFRPKILICGGSSYPRDWDFSRFRQIADKCGAVLMCDMAHISGLVAAKECASPFDYCDIVTSTTHKGLRGPRGGIIFYRKGSKSRERSMLQNQGNDSHHYNFEEKINFAVFPSLQGGPHNNHIAALAVAFKQVATPEYKAYIQQVKKNAQVLASALLRRKCRLVTGGTDNHLLLWDLSTLGLTGKNYERVCEMCHITLNKCAIYGDNGAIFPGGVRIGTPAMTTRGCLESDFETIADFLLRAAQITCSVQRKYGKLQKDFVKGLENNNDIVQFRDRVELFASQFAMPAFDL